MPHKLRNIAVCFDTSEAGLRELEVAAELACRQKAYLIGLFFVQDSNSPGGELYRYSAINIDEARVKSSFVTQLLRAKQLFDQAAIRHCVNSELRLIPRTKSSGDAALRTLHCDVLVAGYPLGIWSMPQIKRLGVPLMLIPSAWRGKNVGRRILLAWNAHREARRSMADSLPLLLAAEVVHLLLVEAEDSSNEADDRAETEADIADYLRSHGVTVTMDRVTASQKIIQAEGVMSVAVDCDADLIVFGAHSRSLALDEGVDGIVRTLLSAGLLPMFLSS